MTKFDCHDKRLPFGYKHLHLPFQRQIQHTGEAGRSWVKALFHFGNLLIGVTALANNLVMVTENVKHVGHIPELEIENWAER